MLTAVITTNLTNYSLLLVRMCLPRRQYPVLVEKSKLERSHVNRVTAADSESVAVMSTELLQLTVRLSQSCQQSYYS